MFECPDAVLSCAILRCEDPTDFIFGGHDKTLYLMDQTLLILDKVYFDGWVRSVFPVDLDGDGCDEVLVGSGDGTCAVLKWDKTIKKLIAIMRYKPSQNVNISGTINCCVAGDIYFEGNISLIFGGQDNTLKIFKSIDFKEPNAILNYDSWVTACEVGVLILPQFQDPINGIIVGTKNGLLQLVQVDNNIPNIIWEINLNAQINVIKVGDLTKDGHNEIVVGTTDGLISVIDGGGKKIKEIKMKDTFPLSVLIEDIDGDNSSELIVGCANGFLGVFQNLNLNSSDLQLKWKIQVSTSITSISSYRDKEKINHIVFGGYDRTLRDVVYFEFGMKKNLQIPKKFVS